jgi:MSHA biogenesis protein MshN
VSLINQVLKDVEARQGGTMNDGWAGQQVKPVLTHQPSTSRQWAKRLIWLLMIAGLVAWIIFNRTELSAFYRSTLASIPLGSEKKSFGNNSQTKLTVTTLPAKAAIPETPKQASTMGNPVLDAHPQLTKSLFSEWQAELAESVTKPPIRQKVTPAPVSKQTVVSKQTSAKGEAPQVEGEFSIKPTESNSSGTVVSVVEPPLESGNAGKSKATAETSTETNGTVNKHVRPEQEVNLLIQKAVDHEQKGRLSEALTILRQALVTYPQSEDARQLLAAYLFETKQEAEAVAVLQAGIKRNPEQVGLSKSLAKWQLSHNQPEAVLLTLKPFATVLARDAESQWMQAIACQQLGQHQAALPYFERAIILRPGQAQWVVAYAISLQASGQNAQALQQLQSAQTMPLSERLAEFVNQRIRQLGGSVQPRDE